MIGEQFQSGPGVAGADHLVAFVSEKQAMSSRLTASSSTRRTLCRASIPLGPVIKGGSLLGGPFAA